MQHFQEFIERPEVEIEAKGQDITMIEPALLGSSVEMKFYATNGILLSPVIITRILIFRKYRKVRVGIFAIKLVPS